MVGLSFLEIPKIWVLDIVSFPLENCIGPYVVDLPLVCPLKKLVYFTLQFLIFQDIGMLK